jgi:hypothetical protein
MQLIYCKNSLKKAQKIVDKKGYLSFDVNTFFWESVKSYIKYLATDFEFSTAARGGVFLHFICKDGLIHVEILVVPTSNRKFVSQDVIQAIKQGLSTTKPTHSH